MTLKVTCSILICLILETLKLMKTANFQLLSCFFRRVGHEENGLCHEKERRLLRSTYQERMQVSATKRNQLFQEKKRLQVTKLQSCVQEPVLCGENLVSCHTELNKFIVIATLLLCSNQSLGWSPVDNLSDDWRWQPQELC